MTGKYQNAKSFMAYGPSAAKYFLVRPDLTQSISILLYDHSAFPFFFPCFFSFNFRVIKFVMFTYVALFDRKVGIYIATKLF